ncbi:DEAD/DEAH box helicase family protein [Flavobacterium beibuense]|uniref:Helicase ATP-binding domain-containing protein n=1 Tax=Flavobacterium beibuense TaxID=657326 RepID=A0A444WC06_9FLAO|nr:DEAD/DEAH box helicase [Flavobacterium beibuense]RYJ43274.1 hypothetical protein NU09_1612 [Flavobacterium beibuense]
MNLPNSLFEDFPIEFKEINPEDFPLFEVENNREKIIIEPDNRGYINDTFQEKIDLRHKNTVVVNAAVGQGKSTAIINTIGKYYRNHPNTIIIVASPFVSLVEQYCNDIHVKAEIPEEQIYNYGLIGRNSTIDYKQRRIHVITANTLLGNPGEDAFRNSDKKRQYLNGLISHCEENHLEVVFVYDEIHDAIQNFKEEYIFSLWKWKNVILKNYILSATYNEASKVVIEYLAELTDKKIQIIESKRVVFPEKQSKLYLHYSPAFSFQSSNPELERLVKDLIDKDKQIDILSFSKKLAKEIINDEEGIGKLLKDKFGELNDCTSELNYNQRLENAAPTNRFDNTMCNVGTNFKTGVSIEKDNHAFIIILPSRSTRMEFANQNGIFSGGINSIIQALARQRTPGEIHILLPNPDKFVYDSLLRAGMSETQIGAFKQQYDVIMHHDARSKNKVEYFKLDSQDELISTFYQTELYGNVVDEVTYMENKDRDSLAPLRYPPYKLFKLSIGEDYLASYYGFFGKDVSAYLTYCAITNQFVNCKLAEVSYKPTLYFKEGKIQKRLWFYFKTYFEDYRQIKRFTTFNHFYNEVRARFFSTFKLILKSENSSDVIKPYHKLFESQLLLFCAKEYFGRGYHYWNRNFDITSDIEFSRSTYFLSCIAIAETLKDEEPDYSEELNNKIQAYKNLGKLRDKLIDKVATQSRGNTQYNYLPVKPIEGLLTQEEKDLLIDTASILIEFDDLIKNDVFNFRRNLLEADESAKPIDKQIESIYRRLVEDFFELTPLENYPIVTINGERVKVKPIAQNKELPNPEKVVDTLRIDPLIVFANEYYGSFETYQSMINSALAESN